MFDDDDDDDGETVTELDLVLAQSKGAQFHRGDLHIHSLGGSHYVSDARMTPASIVQVAAREKLSLIAVTDHNEIANVADTIQAAAPAGVCVIPGVELSTQQGHLLCYLPTLEALQRFHGQALDSRPRDP